MKSRKRHITEGIELPNQEEIRTFGEKKTYEYLEIMEADTIKKVEIKEKKIKKAYLRRTRRLPETKVYYRNLIRGINTWAVPLVRYSGLFLKWIREDLKKCTREQEN